MIKIDQYSLKARLLAWSELNVAEIDTLKKAKSNEELYRLNFFLCFLNF